jgi:hypothetical protein
MQIGWYKAEPSSSKEIADLFSIVDRSQADLKVGGISDDLRYQAAYNDVLTLANIVLCGPAAFGYLKTRPIINALSKASNLQCGGKCAFRRPQPYRKHLAMYLRGSIEQWRTKSTGRDRGKHHLLHLIGVNRGSATSQTRSQRVCRWLESTGLLWMKFSMFPSSSR